MGLGVMVLEKLATARKDTRPLHPTGKLLETETANRNGRCTTRRTPFAAFGAGIAYGVAIGALPNRRECSFKANRTLDVLAHLIVALRGRAPFVTLALLTVCSCIPLVSMLHVGLGHLRIPPGESAASAVLFKFHFFF